MPIIKSAKKKMRQDKKRTLRNKKSELKLKSLVKQVRRGDSTVFSKMQSTLDKAVKTKLIHKNKASRLKSRLSKNAPSPAVKPTAKTAQKTSPKTTKKS